MLPVSIEDVTAAAQRIAGHAVRTPLLRLPVDGDVYAKCENLQRTGSFKFRGAFNAVASLLEREGNVRGVVADSSGNHAQGVAAAAHLLGVKSCIVIPRNAPAIKVQRTAAWGAEIVRCPDASDERMAVARQISLERGFAYVAPFDNADVIAGQGTAGLEICEDLQDVQTVLVCVGGGGLLSGIVTAVKTKAPNARVIGVEPELAADAQESFRSGKRVSWDASLVTRTVCDGVRTQGIGVLNFQIISALVDDMVTVPEVAIISAMRFYALEAKLAVEPTGALTLAALQSGAVEAVGKTVCLVSGGNFDPVFYGAVIAGGA